MHLPFLKLMFGRDDAGAQEFDTGIEFVEMYAKSHQECEFILCITADYILRSSVRYCNQTGPLLRKWLKHGNIKPNAAQEILEKWERYPVLGFDPNLGATIYEHLFEHEDCRQLFEKWKTDPVLRKQYISVAYCLPIKEEIETYEWAISIGESAAAQESMRTFAPVRQPPNDVHLKARWEQVLLQLEIK